MYEHYEATIRIVETAFDHLAETLGMPAESPAALP
jgi:hypothetical protein